VSLNFDDYQKPQKRKSPIGILIGISALIGVVALGSTLAANINLNTGHPVEFGQGVTQTVACSGTTPITLTPQSTFINLPAGNFTATTSAAERSAAEQLRSGNQTPRGTFYFTFGIPNEISVTPGMLVSGVGIDPDTYVEFAKKGQYTDHIQTIWLSKELTGSFVKGEEVTFSGGGHYVMSSISVTNIPASCDGVNFIFKAYGNTGQLSHLVVGACFNPYQNSGWDGRSIQATYDLRISGSTLTGNTDRSATNIHALDGGFKITFGGPNGPGYCMGAPANDVYKLTVESFANNQTSRDPNLGAYIPANLVENPLNHRGFTYGADADGIWMNGNANGFAPAFPIISQNSFSAGTKIQIDAKITYANECSDQAILIYATDILPRFKWGSTNNDSLISEFNCGTPQIGGPNDSYQLDSFSGLDLGSTYAVTVIYDPSALTDNLELITKDLSGTVLADIKLSQKLATSGTYRVGFSADHDPKDGASAATKSYFKDIIFQTF